MSGRARALAAVPLAALLAAAAARAGEASPPPACLALADLAPDVAFAGQQLLYRVRVLRRASVASADWSTAPSFPGFRAEWLPGRAEAEPQWRGGARYRVSEQHVALYAYGRGELEVRAPALRCRAVDGSARLAPVPPARLRVRGLPAGDRPADFSGLVGPVTLAVAATPRRVALGGVVRVEVELRGRGNLWDADDPLPELPGADVFRRAPELELRRASSLHASRRFRYDVVPRSAGALAVPEIRVPWFDPVEERYAVAAAQLPAVQVDPRR